MTRPRTSGRVGGLHDIREVLGLTLSKHRLHGGISKASGIVLWPEVVGPELAKMTRARTQQGTTLFIEVRDSSMAHFLTMQRGIFLSILQEKLGNQSVTELRFSVGTLQKVAPVALPDILPAPDQARAEELAAHLPPNASPELRGAALKAAQAITRARRWREQQGYAPCPVCGEPSKRQPCYACTLTLQDPLVRRAAAQLLRGAARLESLTESLGLSGTEAARYLALGQLTEQLRLLALECVQSGAGDNEHYLRFLRQQAQHYLYLVHRRDLLSRADYLALPDAVRQLVED